MGITPFLAFLEARQPAARRDVQSVEGVPVQLHYCTRDARHDPLIARVRMLSELADPPVELIVHDAAAGDFFEPRMLQQHDERKLDIWLCGPSGLAAAVRTACRRVGAGRWRLHSELFAMR